MNLVEIQSLIWTRNRQISVSAGDSIIICNILLSYLITSYHTSCKDTCSISAVLTYLVAVSEGLEKSDLTTDQENDCDIPKTTI